MKKVLITGSSNGIGKAAAELFLDRGFEVIGLDLQPSSIDNDNYTHYICDCSDKKELPDVANISILINNAGSQNSVDDIKNNLYSAIYVTEKYGFEKSITSILFNASVSAHNGFEFPMYVASKGGMLTYSRHVASLVAKNGVTCNSISCGGVITDLNKPVMDNKQLWEDIMKVTPMKKWASAEEIAEWIYFFTVVNKSCTGQDLIIDNGEMNCNNTFIWPEE